MVGSWFVEVRRVAPYTIYGDLYYELDVLRIADPAAGADQGWVLRVPEHATAGKPQPGDRLTVTFLMGQVTSAKPA